MNYKTRQTSKHIPLIGGTVERLCKTTFTNLLSLKTHSFKEDAIKQVNTQTGTDPEYYTAIQNKMQIKFFYGDYME